MRTADIIINRWQTMEIFEDVHEISPQFAQNDILDLADEIARLRAANTRLTAELAAARGEHVWSKMGELGLATMCLDWEIGRVFAFNTDGDMVADKETIQEVFDSLS